MNARALGLIATMRSLHVPAVASHSHVSFFITSNVSPPKSTATLR
jgi:hypothetical protein